MAQSNYGDFISQYLSDNFVSTNGNVTPNPNNPKTHKRRKMAHDIEMLAKKKGVPAHHVAFDIVRANEPRINKYILSKGERPDKRTTGKALQAFVLRNKELGDLSKVMSLPKSDVQVFLDQAEYSAEKLGHPDADNLLGEIFEALAKVAQPFANQQAAKRAKGGKPAGFWGTIAEGGTGQYNAARKAGGYDKIKADAGADTGNSDAPATGGAAKSGGALDNIKIRAQEIIDGLRKAETKKAINKYLPWAILGLLVIIVATVVLSKMGKKK